MSRKSIIIAIAIIVVLAAGGFIALRMFGGSGNSPVASPSEAGLPPPIPTFAATSNASAYDVALARAVLWHADAKLAKMSSAPGSLDAAGVSSKWDFIFVSPSAPKKGFEVVVSGNAITSAAEIMIVEAGGTLPPNLISTDEAIARMRSVPGYATATVISVEAIYGPDGSQWYWGVKTNKGITTMKATQ